MATERIRIDPAEIRASSIARAAKILRDGGLVAFPTETVYGIGVRHDDEGAIQRLFDLKQRPRDKPLAYHVPNVGSLIGMKVYQQMFVGMGTPTMPLYFVGSAGGVATIGS